MEADVDQQLGAEKSKCADSRNVYRSGQIISEVDAFDQDDDCDEALCQECNNRYRGSRAIHDYHCTHDGSMEEGVELVTHPMTLEYHLNEFPWDKILSKAKFTDYTSHQAMT